MPEHIKGPSGDLSRGDSEQWLRTTLMQVLAQQEVLARSQEMLTRAVAELVTELAEVAQAAGDQAASPDRPRRHAGTRRRGRRPGDTFLRIVPAGVGIAICLVLALAAMAPRHIEEQRYTPGPASQVANVHNDHDADDR